jgi:prolyl oligopeptidase
MFLVLLTFKGFLVPVKIIDKFDAMYSYITNNGTVFYIQTNKNAPKYKLVTMDIAHPEKETVEIVKEHEKDVIEWITCVNDHFIINYIQDAKQVLKSFNFEGKHVYDFPVPTVGSVTSATGKRKRMLYSLHICILSFKDKELFYSFISFLHPGVIYHYDFATSDAKVFRKIEVKSKSFSCIFFLNSLDFNPDLFTTKQIFYSSKDGTQVPMFVVHKKVRIIFPFDSYFE